MSTDEYQQAVIKSTEGCILVSASPGSGKTYVMIHKMFALAKTLKQGMGEILFTTFTKKSANELTERLNKLAKAENVDINIQGGLSGTMHSICFRLLKECNYMTADCTILTNYSQKKIFKEIVEAIKPTDYVLLDEDEKVDKETKTSYINNILKDYDLMCTMPIQEYQQVNKIKYNKNKDIMDYYARKKIELNSIDFNDILTLFYNKLLQEYNGDIEKKILTKSTLSKIKYIFFDEYQDINNLQYAILKLVIRHNNTHFFCVGDEKQTIYSFRGSNNDIIHNFEADFINYYKPNEVKTYHLIHNYRSTPAITRPCSQFIRKQNPNNLSKEMIGKNNNQNQIPKLYYSNKLSFNDYIEKRNNKIIELLKDKKFNIKEQVILSRKKAPLKILAYTLFKNNIPYEEAGNSIMDKAEIQDLIALWNFIVNPKNYHDLIRILVLLPKIGKKTADELVKKIYDVATTFSKVNTDINIHKNDNMGPLDWMNENTIELQNIDFKTDIKEVNKQQIIKTMYNIDKTIVLAKLLDKVWNNDESDKIENKKINNKSDIINDTLDFLLNDDFITIAYKTKEPTALKKTINLFVDTLFKIQPNDYKRKDKLKNINIDNLKDVLTNINLYNDLSAVYDETGHKQYEKLSLSTIHAAKGYQWKRIILIDDGFNNVKKYDVQDEEEARIIFVALSRAEQEIHIFTKVNELKDKRDCVCDKPVAFVYGELHRCNEHLQIIIKDNQNIITLYETNIKREIIIPPGTYDRDKFKYRLELLLLGENNIYIVVDFVDDETDETNVYKTSINFKLFKPCKDIYLQFDDFSPDIFKNYIGKHKLDNSLKIEIVSNKNIIKCAHDCKSNFFIGKDKNIITLCENDIERNIVIPPDTYDLNTLNNVLNTLFTNEDYFYKINLAYEDYIEILINVCKKINPLVNTDLVNTDLINTDLVNTDLANTDLNIYIKITDKTPYIFKTNESQYKFEKNKIIIKKNSCEGDYYYNNIEYIYECEKHCPNKKLPNCKPVVGCNYDIPICKSLYKMLSCIDNKDIDRIEFKNK